MYIYSQALKKFAFINSLEYNEKTCEVTVNYGDIVLAMKNADDALKMFRAIGFRVENDTKKFITVDENNVLCDSFKWDY